MRATARAFFTRGTNQLQRTRYLQTLWLVLAKIAAHARRRQKRGYHYDAERRAYLAERADKKLRGRHMNQF